MTKRSAVLLVVLVSLIFASCTGCAGMVLRPDGTVVAYAIGKGEAQVVKIPASQACDYTGDYTPAVYSRTKLGQPAYCESQGPGMTFSVEGGNLGSGWFGVITTFIAAYFGGGLIP